MRAPFITAAICIHAVIALFFLSNHDLEQAQRSQLPPLEVNFSVKKNKQISSTQPKPAARKHSSQLKKNSATKAQSRSSQNNVPSNTQQSGMTGSDQILALIQSKIEKAKFYPRRAQKKGITGQVQVSFTINQSGQVEKLRITRSSHSQILDHAALRTIQKAQPLPYYPRTLEQLIIFE